MDGYLDFKNALIDTCRMLWTADDNQEYIRLVSEDLNFALGFRDYHQWNSNDVATRTAKPNSQPVLTVNRVYSFIRQIVNTWKQQRQSILYKPAGGDSSIEVAEVLNGIARAIQRDSMADQARDMALTHAVACGRGYMEVDTEFENERSFETKIIILPVEDPLSVKFGFSIKPDKSDAEYCILRKKYNYSKAKLMFGFDKLTSVPARTSVYSRYDTTDQKEFVYLWKVYYYVYKKRKLVLIPDVKAPLPSVEALVTQNLRQPLLSVYKDEYKGPEVDILAQREEVTRTLWCAVLDNDKILSNNPVPFTKIPVVEIVGSPVYEDGVCNYKGITRDIRDLSYFLNYLVTTTASVIQSMPKNPFIVADGQISPAFQRMWEQFNVEFSPYLPYKPVSVDGVLAPPPQRTNSEAQIQALVTAILQVQDMMQVVVGLNDSSLGLPGNETSGRAIGLRQQQGATATFNFLDTMASADTVLGEILLEQIQKWYNTERIVMILDDMGRESFKKVNTTDQDRITVGEYTVSSESGINHKTAQQEAIAFLTDIVRAAPDLSQIITPAIVENLSFRGSQKLARMLSRLIPENLKDPEQGVDPAQLITKLQEMQAMFQQQDLQVTELGDIIKKLELELVNKAGELEIRQQEVDIKRFVAETNARTQTERE
jgi:hypothetical protein